MKKILILLIIFSLKVSNVYSIEPDVFVQSTVNRASQILSKDITKEQKIIELKSIAKETVDIIGVGFYSLGSARKNLNENQKKQYLNLFEKYFLKSLTSRLSEYSDQTFEVTGSEQKSANYTIVFSKVTGETKSPEIKVISLADIAMSVPVPTAIPTSACASAGASLMPSPTIPTTFFNDC